MPTYEYHCEACKHDFEKFHSMSAPPVKVCPKCGKRKVVRKIGVGAGIIFKGGGFYETDYRNESYKKAAEAEKSDGAEKKPDAAPTTTDAKPAAETPATPKAEPKPAKSESKPAAKSGKRKR